MTPEQFERWGDFAERMARTIYGDSKRPSGAWVMDQVLSIWADLRDDAGKIHNWDNGDDHLYVCDVVQEAEGCERPGFYWDITDRVKEKIQEADNALSDEIRELPEHEQEEAYRALNAYLDALRDKLIGEDEENVRRREQLAIEQWSDQFFGPVRCCLRAGLDMAAAPSGGVVGFTAGDIRRMYPEGMPDWLGDITFDQDENGHGGIKLRDIPPEDGVWL